ncbi:PDR/VanB family oxidoreductase [Piscinibacter sakaiensis]|uniref:Flavodoxin reductase (Ferredoxin-NADPH reductase) family 1 n=1 Tax=Piscinibacter sakaiensis TaxID=1547922 RepID=A0A0K8P3G9_PISS1|nr:PDR/VanB family oxidoreductase [Piscinibacter sakaiensis]GAP37153.1 flavodoxin reductase (ferredoxin-NADPH reductase) family 1 [Piscinibacter sakaiensis]
MSGLLNLRLRQIRWEAEGICSYEFVPAAGRALPAFTAGAHVDLHLPEQRIRSYSLLNDPAETHRYVVAVQRDEQGRGGSEWMHTALRVGQRLQASPPVNDFALADSDAPAVLIAGGIGITPILSMLKQLDRQGRRWSLHYAARSAESAAFVDELKTLASAANPLQLSLSGSGAERLDIAGIVGQAPPESHLYCCGPARMIDAFLAAGAALPAQRVHVERFAAGNEAATAGGFEVVLQRSGQRVPVLAGQTILDALLDRNVSVQYACSSGVCGTCRTRVVDGTPDHRDDYLADDEKAANDCIMVCCSGSKSATLVLDL